MIEQLGTNRVGKVLVSRSLLAELLFAPGTYIHEITPLREMFLSDGIEFLVEHPALDELKEGEKIPYYQAVAQKIEKRFEKYA